MPLLLLLLIGGGLFLATRKQAAPTTTAGSQIQHGAIYQFQIIDPSGITDPGAIANALTQGNWILLSGAPANVGQAQMPAGMATIWNVGAAQWNGPSTNIPGGAAAILPGTNLAYSAITGPGI